MFWGSGKGGRGGGGGGGGGVSGRIPSPVAIGGGVLFAVHWLAWRPGWRCPSSAALLAQWSLMLHSAHTSRGQTIDPANGTKETTENEKTGPTQREEKTMEESTADMAARKGRGVERVGLRVNIPADDHFGLRERCLRHGIEEASQSPE